MPMPRDASPSTRSTASAIRRWRGIKVSSRFARCGRRAPAPPRSEFWRTLFRERLDAFLDLVATHALAVAAVGGFLVELAAGEFVDGALHAAHRLRCVSGQYVGEPVDFLIERFLRHHRG